MRPRTWCLLGARARVVGRLELIAGLRRHAVAAAAAATAAATAVVAALELIARDEAADRRPAACDLASRQRAQRPSRVETRRTHARARSLALVSTLVSGAKPQHFAALSTSRARASASASARIHSLARSMPRRRRRRCRNYGDERRLQSARMSARCTCLRDARRLCK